MDILGLSSSPQTQAKSSFWDNDGFGFGDILDAVNPFQHIPIISDLYQEITGDSMGGLANVVGSTIFGGPIAGGVALANEVVRADTGKTISQNVFSADEPTKTAALANEKYEKAADLNEPRRSTTHNWIYGGTHLA